MASFSEDVKGLSLDVGVVEHGPFEVLLGQLGVCRVTCSFANRLDSLGAIDGLLSADGCSQPEARVSMHMHMHTHASTRLCQCRAGTWGDAGWGHSRRLGPVEHVAGWPTHCPEKTSENG